MLATVKGNVKENTVVIDDEEIDTYKDIVDFLFIMF